MHDDAVSRRDFLYTSGAALHGAWIAANLPAIRAAAKHARAAAGTSAPFQTLSTAEARDLDAIAALIFPTDDTPGAREAGVIHFMDRALGDFAAESLEAIRAGLVELQATVDAAHPGAGAFADLPLERQAAILTELEQREEPDFFDEVRTLTVQGMFALSSYGGNQHDVGWALLGFDASPVFRPPFGYYDRPEGP
jgi:gluconate 2-dehydrogenase gamma chain